MEEKKSIKISLSMFFLIIAIIVIIAMACYIYVEKMKSNQEIEKLEANASNMQKTIDNLQGKIDNISNTINSNETSNGNDSSVKNNEISNLKIGTYTINGVEVTPDPESYGIYSITLQENNQFSVNMPLGTSYTGEYKIENNKLICNALKEKIEEGGGSTSNNTNITFEFKIKNSSEIEFSDVNNEEFKLTLGRTYSIK